mmetsp:Transcript_50118/g.60491  ORF Transcript_50118/g.60491 Transcript_50118/m.60491 type:complete len:344 (-) Transcript_50118:695-1726(-)
MMLYFEAVCRRIVSDLPHVHALYIQSDNARCYKKSNLLFGVFKIAQAYGLQLSSYIHTGVQDGKGPIDAHFATAMKHVHRCCAMGHDVVTSTKLVQALKANGGVNNSVSEMVGINRRQVKKFEAVNFCVLHGLRTLGEHLETKFESNVAVVFEYSNVGVGKRFLLKLEGDNYSTNATITNENECDNSEEHENANEESSTKEMILDADDDFVEEIAMNEVTRGKVTRCIVYAADAIDTKKRRLGRIDVVVLDVESDNEDSLKCTICNRSFSHGTNLLQHLCLGAVGKKDLLSRGVWYARSVLDQHDFQVITTSIDTSTLHVLAPVTALPFDGAEYSFSTGWTKT